MSIRFYQPSEAHHYCHYAFKLPVHGCLLFTDCVNDSRLELTSQVLTGTVTDPQASTRGSLQYQSKIDIRSLSLTQINFKPTWISNYIHNKMWDEIFNCCNPWKLGMYKSFYPPLYCVYDDLSKLGFKLNPISKRCPWYQFRLANAISWIA